MHAVSHSLTHRGPGARSARTSRWQPYASTTLNATPPLVRSPYPYLHTPPSSVLSSATPSTTHISPIALLDRGRPAPSNPAAVKQQAAATHASSVREQNRKYVCGLLGEFILIFRVYRILSLVSSHHVDFIVDASRSHPDRSSCQFTVRVMAFR